VEEEVDGLEEAELLTDSVWLVETVEEGVDEGDWRAEGLVVQEGLTERV
jgi:hypothetical protein